MKEEKKIVEGTGRSAGGARGVKAAVNRFAKEAMALIFPSHCSVCGATLDADEKSVCRRCYAALPFTHFKAAADNPVERLFYSQPGFVRGNSFLFYIPHSHSGNMVRQLKYGNHVMPGIDFGERMARDLVDGDIGFFDPIDCVVPVPLSLQRLNKRGYNQSDYLARGVRKATGLPVNVKLLERTVDNPTQTRLTHYERRSNVEGIFRVRKPESLDGLHILLIDDVITTGATLMSCLQAIHSANPSVRCSVLSLYVSISFAFLPAYSYDFSL